MKNAIIIALCLGAIGFSTFHLLKHQQLVAQKPLGSGALAYSESVSNGEFNPRQVVPPFDPISDAPFIDVSEVTDQVLDNELVLGLELNDEARAYPINMLTGPSREIINDTLGGIPIAATW
jgi:hypothetical protein